MARILPTLDLTGFGRCEFAMEAVVEDLDVKRRVFGELEVRLRPDALLATNTSSLSVEALAGGLQRPERFCGFHFFNPVHRMPLVEVVRGPRTSDATLVTADNMAIQSCGLIAVIGEITCLSAALFALPAVLAWRDRRRAAAEATARELPPVEPLVQPERPRREARGL